MNFNTLKYQSILWILVILFNIFKPTCPAAIRQKFQDPKILQHCLMDYLNSIGIIQFTEPSKVLSEDCQSYHKDVNATLVVLYKFIKFRLDEVLGDRDEAACMVDVFEHTKFMEYNIIATTAVQLQPDGYEELKNLLQISKNIFTYATMKCLISNEMISDFIGDLGNKIRVSEEEVGCITEYATRRKLLTDVVISDIDEYLNEKLMENNMIGDLNENDENRDNLQAESQHVAHTKIMESTTISNAKIEYSTQHIFDDFSNIQSTNAPESTTIKNDTDSYYLLDKHAEASSMEIPPTGSEIGEVINKIALNDYENVDERTEEGKIDERITENANFDRILNYSPSENDVNEFSTWTSIPETTVTYIISKIDASTSYDYTSDSPIESTEDPSTKISNETAEESSEIIHTSTVKNIETNLNPQITLPISTKLKRVTVLNDPIAEHLQAEMSSLESESIEVSNFPTTEINTYLPTSTAELGNNENFTAVPMARESENFEDPEIFIFSTIQNNLNESEEISVTKLNLAKNFDSTTSVTERFFLNIDSSTTETDKLSKVSEKYANLARVLENAEGSSDKSTSKSIVTEEIHTEEFDETHFDLSSTENHENNEENYEVSSSEDHVSEMRSEYHYVENSQFLNYSENQMKVNEIEIIPTTEHVALREKCRKVSEHTSISEFDLNSEEFELKSIDISTEYTESKEDPEGICEMTTSRDDNFDGQSNILKKDEPNFYPTEITTEDPKTYAEDEETSISSSKNSSKQGKRKLFAFKISNFSGNLTSLTSNMTKSVQNGLNLNDLDSSNEDLYRNNPKIDSNENQSFPEDYEDPEKLNEETLQASSEKSFQKLAAVLNAKVPEVYIPDSRIKRQVPISSIQTCQLTIDNLESKFKKYNFDSMDDELNGCMGSLVNAADIDDFFVFVILKKYGSEKLENEKNKKLMNLIVSFIGKFIECTDLYGFLQMAGWPNGR